MSGTRSIFEIEKHITSIQNTFHDKYWGGQKMFERSMYETHYSIISNSTNLGIQSGYEKTYPKTWQMLQNGYESLWLDIKDWQDRKETQNAKDDQESPFRALYCQLMLELEVRPELCYQESIDWHLGQRKLERERSLKEEELTTSEKRHEKRQLSYVHQQFELLKECERAWRSREGQPKGPDQSDYGETRSVSEDEMYLAGKVEKLSSKRVKIVKLAEAKEGLISKQRENIYLRHKLVFKMEDACTAPFTRDPDGINQYGKNNLNGSGDTVEPTDQKGSREHINCQDDGSVDAAEAIGKGDCTQIKKLFYEFESQPRSKPLFPGGPTLSSDKQFQFHLLVYSERLEAYYEHIKSVNPAREKGASRTGCTVEWYSGTTARWSGMGCFGGQVR
jgi:hypothetical protein